MGTGSSKGSETKNATDGFHQHLTPTRTHIWLTPQIPSAERAYRSASVIFGVGALGSWWESEWAGTDMTRGSVCSVPMMSEAKNTLFIWTYCRGLPTLSSSSSIPLSSRQIVKGPVLREVLRIGCCCWLKLKNIPSWESDFCDDLIKQR